MAAQAARTFGDSVGVGVRLHWTDTSWADFDTIQARLRELGVRYVTDGFCPDCPQTIDRLNRLAAMGIRAHLGLGTLREGSAHMHASLAVIRSQVRGAVVSVQGPNEPDHEPISDWVGRTRAYQRELYSSVKRDPALADLQVLGPALVERGSRAALGDLSAYLDRGNIHPYPGGNLPLLHLADEKSLASHVSGSKPLVITEVGYHADVAYDGVHRAASELANSMYTPRLALEAFRGGVERTYFFIFADAWSPTEAERLGVPSTTNSFGLLRWDLTPRPSFFALRNLLRAVDGASPPVPLPGGLRFGLDGAGPDVRHLLLRSADGTYALVLWRQVSVWDREAKRDLTPAPDALEVVLGQPISLARQFDPAASDAEIRRWTDPRRIPLDLAGAPLVLRLTPAAEAAALPPPASPPASSPRAPAGAERTRLRRCRARARARRATADRRARRRARAVRGKTHARSRARLRRKLRLNAQRQRKALRRCARAAAAGRRPG